MHEALPVTFHIIIGPTSPLFLSFGMDYFSLIRDVFSMYYAVDSRLVLIVPVPGH